MCEKGDAAGGDNRWDHVWQPVGDEYSANKWLLGNSGNGVFIWLRKGSSVNLASVLTSWILYELTRHVASSLC